MKKFWKSKTLWANAIAIGVHYVKPVLGIDALPDVDIRALAVINLILRVITKQPIGF